jgi:hypothetical protein
MNCFENMEEQYYDVKRLQDYYTQTLGEIFEGKNLSRHLISVQAAIDEVEKKILTMKENDKALSFFETMKNDLYYLKFEILERQ